MLVVGAVALFIAGQSVHALQEAVSEACVLLANHTSNVNAAIFALAAVCCVYLLLQWSSSKTRNAASNNNTGILGIEVYFPSSFVSQADLEQANGVSAGKYTKGLGQEAMAFTGDREDINSIALTVVQNLLEKYKISPEKVGRLEIGTETLIDKSKSTKTTLMSLFKGNSDIEGATVFNACYGGTAALLNALQWVDSTWWDGRYAIVVAADIAVYEDGPARPSGGCGAVALLIGRDAPLAVNLSSKTTHACDVWDFFKPNMDSEYPVVNGALSQSCYLKALDDCYTRFCNKKGRFSVDAADFFLFHSPYNKLVQKSFGRLMFLDARNGTSSASTHDVAAWLHKPLEETYTDRDLEANLKAFSAKKYAALVEPSCHASKQIGNTYTAALYVNLASLVSDQGAALENKDLVMFSYGSGALATMFEIRTRGVSHEFSLARIAKAVSMRSRLQARQQASPAELTLALQARQLAHGAKNFTPCYPIDTLFPGTYYLEHVNENSERVYARRDTSPMAQRNGELCPKDLLAKLNAPTEEPATAEPVTASPRSSGSEETKSESGSTSSVGVDVPIVVTGVAAGIPGSEKACFSSESLAALLNGSNCITPLNDEIKREMLEKNVVMIKKADGKQVRCPVKTQEENIQLAARIGKVDLTAYGVAESIADTMDRAVQVAVAAGLEACKDAGLVRGDSSDPEAWVLPEDMQDTTGVMYATSFPALDSAINEVMRFLKSQSLSNAQIASIVPALQARLERATDALDENTLDALNHLRELTETLKDDDLTVHYEFDRKFLFRVLVLGNAQLAQLIKARGPNVQTNAACAGTTQAIAIAADMIRVGRAERMIVVAGDNASSDTLIPWLGNGFRALGAATIQSSVELAALPFDARRSGMILGAGAIGVVIEREDVALRRHAESSALANRSPFKCRLVDTWYSNSAYHGVSLDKRHIAAELDRFLSAVERKHGISRQEIARHGVYFSHETCTHATPAASCAANEIFALRHCFGEDLAHMYILNTKGYTGHPMGVSFEDVTAVEVLRTGKLPPIVNLQQPDPYLGNIRLSRGEEYAARYALRFAAGFGSQVVFALYGI